jgi:protocatechuate 4,5-dioxygenase alpha chain
MAMKGYELNKMCFSFNEASNREAYALDEDAYCGRFKLTDEQRRALKERDVLELLRQGGNIYYLAKWAGVFGLSVQQLGAQQRGISLEAFNEMLSRGGGQ